MHTLTQTYFTSLQSILLVLVKLKIRIASPLQHRDDKIWGRTGDLQTIDGLSMHPNSLKMSAWLLANLSDKPALPAAVYCGCSCNVRQSIQIYISASVRQLICLGSCSNKQPTNWNYCSVWCCVGTSTSAENRTAYCLPCTLSCKRWCWAGHQSRYLPNASSHSPNRRWIRRKSHYWWRSIFVLLISSLLADNWSIWVENRPCAPYHPGGNERKRCFPLTVPIESNVRWDEYRMLVETFLQCLLCRPRKTHPTYFIDNEMVHFSIV